MRKFSKKIAVGIAAVSLVAIGGGVAFAYWTTTGTGSGTATNSAGGGTVTLHAIFDAGLAPGNNVPIAYTADNAGSSSTVVGALTVTSITVDAAHDSCLTTDFTATAVTANNTVLATSAGTAVGSGTLTFADTTLNQDGCKGAVVTVNVTSV